MKALVKTAKGMGNIEIRDVSIPKIPKDDWVLIKIKAAGVCGTDLHIWHDQFFYWPPVILGHEFSGEIVEMGSKVTGFDTGDRVVVEPHSLACGKCEFCRQGKIQICSDKRSPGWGIDGAFTEYIVMPSLLLHKIPDGLSYELAAIAEPMAIAVHQVVERGRIECQDFVVVTGAGRPRIYMRIRRPTVWRSSPMHTDHQLAQRSCLPAKSQLNPRRMKPSR